MAEKVMFNWTQSALSIHVAFKTVQNIPIRKFIDVGSCFYQLYKEDEDVIVKFINKKFFRALVVSLQFLYFKCLPPIYRFDLLESEVYHR